MLAFRMARLSPLLKLSLLLLTPTQNVPTVPGQPATTIGCPKRLLMRKCLRLEVRLLFYLYGNLNPPLPVTVLRRTWTFLAHGRRMKLEPKMFLK